MTGFILDTNSKAYLGMLNSSLLQWYISVECAKARGGYLRFKTQYMKNLPLIPAKNCSALNPDVKRIMKLSEAREKVNLNIMDYLGSYSSGKCLKDLHTPLPGISKTILSETKADKSNLKIEDINFSETEKELILEVSAKFKPKDPQGFNSLDQWGYAETELIPTLRFSVQKKLKFLIKEFVPLAIEKANGFANFRETATKTISLFDRLEEITLPKLEDVESGLEKYLDQKERAEKLEREIKKTDHQIDAIVFDLYELREDEVKTVLDSLETPEDEKTDILSKFKKLRGYR